MLIGSGAASALLFSLLLFWGPPLWRIVAIGLLLAALTCVFIGLQKWLEPQESLTLCHDYMAFHHRYGGWAIPWRDVSGAGVPSLRVDWEQQPIDYVGIRLKHYDTLLCGVSFRLASHLLQEQRNLAIAGFRGQHPDQEIPSEWVLENDRFQSAAGSEYRGLVAMLGHRMTHMRDAFGFELLLPAAALDRSPEAFASLVNRYRLAQVQQTEQHAD